MGEVVDLHGQPAQLEDDLDFISDLARYAEGHFFRTRREEKAPPFRRYLGAPWQQRSAHREN